MNRLEGSTLVGQTLRIDNHHFVNCELRNCVLEYGGGPVILEGTQITRCSYIFSGFAKSSIAFLQMVGILSTDGPERPQPEDAALKIQ